MGTVKPKKWCAHLSEIFRRASLEYLLTDERANSPAGFFVTAGPEGKEAFKAKLFSLAAAEGMTVEKEVPLSRIVNFVNSEAFQKPVYLVIGVKKKTRLAVLVPINFYHPDLRPTLQSPLPSV